MYKDTLKKYLDDLASRKPAPGGGSAAALAGALGAALISKVANFTVGKDKYKAVEDEMQQILKRSQQLSQRFNELCSDDALAYKEFSEAVNLPKETAEQKKERQEKLQQALRGAAAVPLEICRLAHDAIKLCLPLAQKGNVNLITDVGIASLMLTCAFESALPNVEINLKSIKDEKFILEVREVLEPLEKEIAAVNQEVN